MLSGVNLPVVGLLAAVVLAAMLSLVSAGSPAASRAEIRHCVAASAGECSVTLRLNGGDQVTGTVSTSPNSGDGSRLWITGPTGSTLFRAGTLDGSAAFLFSAVGTGNYDIHFATPSYPLSRVITVAFTDTPAADC